MAKKKNCYNEVIIQKSKIPDLNVKKIKGHGSAKPYEAGRMSSL